MYVCHAELKKAYETSHIELKGGQNVIMEQLKHILAMLNRPPTTSSAPEAPADPSTPLSVASPPLQEEEVFPDGYDPYEGAPATPIDTCIIHVHDKESQGKILAIEAQPAGVKSRKRKRNPLVWFRDYTEMKKKQRPSSTFDPLAPPDEQLFDTFRKWCCGLIPNHRLRDLRSGDYGPSFFWKLLIPLELLTDDHIDAAMHMLRRRRADYPLTFPQKGIILSTFVTTMISSAWMNHRGERRNFVWEDYILEYCRGVHKFFPRWMGNEFIYFILHLPDQRHWVTVEVDIELWKINVYDCDSSVCHWTAMAPVLKTWEELLPSLIHATGDCPRNNQIMTLTNKYITVLPKMHASRATHDLVPKATISGDCGIYCIEYVEHLMMKRGLTDVTQRRIKLFRERWCVALFYQNIG
ncbi:uncharacterized protein LOC133034957 [Cannabis sativa]|uniref:uncharacterized protein LOC133034957 n=1 Tax=Cannabis sativa TaxID=3483 RepID=UPI0029CA5ADC|nr:uncharacterized protein LOC133034957 [Cannabis sativa]